ncbi:MAG: AI-2E family transporter [Longimicrobiales bacterium]
MHRYLGKTPPTPEKQWSGRVQTVVLLAVVGVITLVFLYMTRQFLMSLLLAAVFAGMVTPVFHWLTAKFGGRRRLASVTTIVFLLGLIVAPLVVFLGIVAEQAVQMSELLAPWIRDQLRTPEALSNLLARIPFADRLLPDAAGLSARLSESVASAGTVAVGWLAAATRGTLGFVLQLFVLLYAMYFFLLDGAGLLKKILHYLPLSSDKEQRLVERFVSVTKATLKGSLVIGVVQGALGGIGFAIAGVPGAAFWGTTMAILSVVPGIGAPLIWIPAVAYLAMAGQGVAAVALGIWCGGAVGTVDNFLRPKLVGRDTKIPDLMVLISTLGGLVMFGPIGFIVGPIVAALFITVWELYGESFGDLLPGSPSTSGLGPERSPSEAATDSRVEGEDSST